MNEQIFAKILENPKIIDFLQENKVYINENQFLKEFDLSNNQYPMISTAHQLGIDYRWSVIAKIAELVHLKTKYGFHPNLIYSDTDKATKGKNKTIINLSWPLIFKNKGLRLLPQTSKEHEIRFAKISDGNFNHFIRGLEFKFSHFPFINTKIDRIKSIYTNSSGNLARFNYLLSNEMMQHYFLTEISTNTMHKIFVEKSFFIKEFISNFPAYNSIFDSEASIINQLIPDFIMTKREYNELPFYLTCKNDLTRNRMFAEKINNHYSGYAICLHCKEKIVFDACNHSIDDLNYVSPDISLMIYLSDEYDGFTGGISSSLYIIIFNKILKGLLGRPEKPTLVSSLLFKKPQCFQECDSLFYYYMTTDKSNYK